MSHIYVFEYTVVDPGLSEGAGNIKSKAPQVAAIFYNSTKHFGRIARFCIDVYIYHGVVLKETFGKFKNLEYFTDSPSAI